eukprot:SM000010S04355  [mRNA]  locus=s10:1123285:1124164:+ [translate_table: standard]
MALIKGPRLFEHSCIQSEDLESPWSPTTVTMMRGRVAVNKPALAGDTSHRSKHALTELDGFVGGCGRMVPAAVAHPSQ